jgi:hypothetical protein
MYHSVSVGVNLLTCGRGRCERWALVLSGVIVIVTRPMSGCLMHPFQLLAKSIAAKVPDLNTTMRYRVTCSDFLY